MKDMKGQGHGGPSARQLMVCTGHDNKSATMLNILRAQQTEGAGDASSVNNIYGSKSRLFDATQANWTVTSPFKKQQMMPRNVRSDANHLMNVTMLLIDKNRNLTSSLPSCLRSSTSSSLNFSESVLIGLEVNVFLATITRLGIVFQHWCGVRFNSTVCEEF